MHEKPAAAASARTAAVVVIYHQIGQLERTLIELRDAVSWVLVVDNRERPIDGLAERVTASGATYLHAGNIGGLAGAYNTALRWLRTRHPEAQQVVFLDDDSDAGMLRSFLTDVDTRRVLTDPGMAAISPAYRDRATGLRGRYMWLRRFRLGFNPREFDDLREVAFIINSMSVWRVSALDRIGPFNEGLAIDHVDTEYCLRARQQGLRLVVNGRFEFAHSIGERRRYRFFGLEVQSGGHSPARRFLIGRNTAWLARQWLWREPAFAALCMARLAYEVIGILIAEDRAAAKLWALLSGAARGLILPLRTR